MSDLPSSTEVRAHVLGPAVAATLEIAIFHPLDTIAKRLMSHRSRLLFPGDVPRTLQNLRQVVYVDAVSFSPSRKIASLYPGLHFALTYKILQRVYKFGGQPVVKNVLYKSNDRWFMKRFGEKNGKIATDALAGALVGAGTQLVFEIEYIQYNFDISRPSPCFDASYSS